ncbi:hypothetical protein K9L16_02730 [Candidatus Pacearchaeota archaeon]|nr:hypothetical protein [Candidatus Pacearchaeota archaeon]
MLLRKDYCQKCLEPISDPICEECHIKNILFWMNENNVPKTTKKKILTRINKNFPKNEIIRNSTCILCKKKDINICSYCTYLIVAKILVNENLSAVLIEDFLQTFNYQLGHAKYPIEIELE